MGVWGITSYFNPAAYRSRWDNYRTFRERLAVPLVTVELSFDGSFQLGPDDADILVQLRGQDVMWQKERLLNVALTHLPDACSAVAWLDCDVILERDDWPQRALRALDAHVLVQPFDRAYELPRGALPEDVPREQIEPGQPSFARQLVDGALTNGVLEAWRVNGDRTTLRDGYAWAGRRDVLERHGFYDARVTGGSTRDLACAALGALEPLIDGRPMTGAQRAHLLDWARAFHGSVQGRIGCLEGAVYHLWHGELENRRYTVRHTELVHHEFDPSRDIALDEAGCWRWSSDKPELHAHVREFFAVRKEDG
jgi:hypothetical protein